MPGGLDGPHVARDVSLFDRFATPYDLAMPPADAAGIRAGLALADRAVERVLDVGGGSGRGARAVDARERLVADAAPGMVRRARRRGLPAVLADAGRLPVRDASVDAVLVVDALHHLPDQPAALAEAARVLRTGGVLVVRDFDPTTVRGRLLVAAERLAGFDSQFRPPDRLAAAVERAGLDPAVPDRGFGYTVAGLRR